MPCPGKDIPGSSRRLLRIFELTFIVINYSLFYSYFVKLEFFSLRKRFRLKAHKKVR